MELLWPHSPFLLHATRRPDHLHILCIASLFVAAPRLCVCVCVHVRSLSDAARVPTSWRNWNPNIFSSSALRSLLLCVGAGVYVPLSPLHAMALAAYSPSNPLPLALKW